MTDTVIESGAVIERAIIDKRCIIEKNTRIGGGIANPEIQLAVVGKNSVVPAGMVVEPGGAVSTDVQASDYQTSVVKSGETIETKRQPYET
jgi:glucose-1-phosphate adenylyltransferase